MIASYFVFQDVASLVSETTGITTVRKVMFWSPDRVGGKAVTIDGKRRFAGVCDPCLDYSSMSSSILYAPCSNCFLDRAIRRLNRGSFISRYSK